jgi:hypothetical protein
MSHPNIPSVHDVGGPALPTEKALVGLSLVGDMVLFVPFTILARFTAVF